jgi:hypothetical protein
MKDLTRLLLLLLLFLLLLVLDEEVVPHSDKAGPLGGAGVHALQDAALQELASREFLQSSLTLLRDGAQGPQVLHEVVAGEADEICMEFGKEMERMEKYFRIVKRFLKKNERTHRTWESLF